MLIQFLIYRYNPDVDNKPYEKLYGLELSQINANMMLLEALEQIRIQDPSLSFRSSCKEGVCGSDGANVNGKNRLCCITRLQELVDEVGNKPITIRPLPGLEVIRDLIVDMAQFYKHYESVEPYLKPLPNKDLDHEIIQTPAERALLDGSYECILCGCCTTSCPSFWWNSDQFIGPAALLNAQRFIIDSRDIHTKERLQELDDVNTIFRCRNIQNCTANCPKDLNPSAAIQVLKEKMLALKVAGKTD